MGLFERAIGVISPGWALNRTRAKASMAFLEQSGYVGASVSRRSLRAWTPWGGDSDTDTLPGLEMLRRRSRDLYRNTPLATGALNTIRTNVVGPGLRL